MISLSGQLSERGLKPFAEEKFVVSGQKMPKIWILVADSGKALFFRKADRLLEKIGEAHPEQSLGSKITNQTAGRVQESEGFARHRLEASDDALKHEAHEFMKELAAFLGEASRGKAFDRLVLALTPDMLGTLRPLLSKDVNMRVMAELNKDLTAMSEKELFSYLDKALWI